MSQVQPNSSLAIPEGSRSIHIRNTSNTDAGRCNIILDSGSQNVSLNPNQATTKQLDGGEGSLDNVGKTILEVTIS